jgi:hypothetical protein
MGSPDGIAPATPYERTGLTERVLTEGANLMSGDARAGMSVFHMHGCSDSCTGLVAIGPGIRGVRRCECKCHRPDGAR